MFAARAKTRKFQSHLRLIHPIHMVSGDMPRRHNQVSIASAPHPPYPRVLVCMSCEYLPAFQSHLRLIHPIHPVRRVCGSVSSNVSIASAPHPPYPLRVLQLVQVSLLCFNRICASSTLSTVVIDKFPWDVVIVSIASAPHPPYPLTVVISYCSSIPSFNRICASSTLSTPASISLKSSMIPTFQSHLRLIHPIHVFPHTVLLCISIVSIASAPHPPYPRE